MSGGRTVVGLQPCLPWPLSGWRWWTEPVRAERLAVLRIALAALLLLDLLTSYLPRLHDFFGPDSLGTPEMFAYLARAPRWNWSLLRGFQDPLLLTVAQCAWLGSTAVIVLGLWGRLGAAGPAGPHPVLRGSLAVWTVAAVFTTFGLWARIAAEPEPGASLGWRVPLAALGVATFFGCLALWRFRSGPDDDPTVWRGVLAAWGVSAALAALSLWKARSGPEGLKFLRWTEIPWHGDPTALSVAFAAWAGAVLLLLLGLWTRTSAAAAWVLSMSFDNLNGYVTNAGDQIRAIALFYLMLSPCGAAWSLDSWRARLRGRRTGPVHVSPWALRLLFVQLTLVYFCNGLYKVAGADWREGTSLSYVLCDLTLTRFSYAQLPLPDAVASLAAWGVLAWELSFPLLVLSRWTRTVALLFGVAFHLGICALLELGNFGPYMLALYLPLLPWDRWLEKRGRQPERGGGSLPKTTALLSGAQEVAAEGGATR